MVGNDQVKALAERLFCRKAKQRGTGTIPANDLTGVVGAAFQLQADAAQRVRTDGHARAGQRLDGLTVRRGVADRRIARNGGSA